MVAPTMPGAIRPRSASARTFAMRHPATGCIAVFKVVYFPDQELGLEAAVPVNVRATDARAESSPLYRRVLALDEIAQLLEDLPHVPPTGDIVKANLNVIRALGEPTQIIDLLKRILADPFVISQIAARSYHHVNHFDKIVLIIPSGRPIIG